MRDTKIAGGTTTIYADVLFGMFRAARRGDFAGANPALGTLFGPSFKTMREMFLTAL